MSLEKYRLSSLREKQEEEAIEEAEKKLRGETKQIKVETRKEIGKKKKK